MLRQVAGLVAVLIIAGCGNEKVGDAKSAPTAPAAIAANDVKTGGAVAGAEMELQTLAQLKGEASCDPANPAAACGDTPWKNLTDAEIRAKLTPEQYAIARNAGTERPFTGKYWNEHRPGVYHCAVCDLELFDAATKFDSGTGWPSFYQPLQAAAVKINRDASHGMVREEVVCARCESHLGHVVDDGPKPTGKRYCMNSAVLKLAVNAKPSPQPVVK